MKLKISVLFLSLIASVTIALAQTNTPPVPAPTNAPPALSGPVMDALTFMSTATTNWMIGAYGIYDQGTKSAGGGIGVGYKLSDFVVPIMRLDYLNDGLWMPSGNLQLQLPLTIMGKVTVIPLAFTGIATPLAGKGNDNGSAVGILGIGLAVRVAQHWDVLADYEKWSGFDGNQYRIAAAYKF